MLAQNQTTIKNSLPPIVTHLAGDDYSVYSPRSGNTYTARVEADGTTAICDCPARARCWHLGFVEQAHERRTLHSGDRVLANEARGPVWHTVLSATAQRVYTREQPAGFAWAFVLRCERAAARRREVAA